MERNFSGDLIECCATRSVGECSTVICTCSGGILVGSSVRTFVRRLGTFCSGFPCAVVGGGRHRCRTIVFAVFAVLNRSIGIRRAASSKEVSLILGASGDVFVFRLGCGGSTSVTVTRVDSGSCTGTFTSSKQGIIGINVGFSRGRQDVRS